MTFPLPVKVAYCLFCLCVHLFSGGEEGALFYFEYICLFIILPQVLILSLFSAFRRFLVVYLVPLCVAVCV